MEAGWSDYIFPEKDGLNDRQSNDTIRIDLMKPEDPTCVFVNDNSSSTSITADKRYSVPVNEWQMQSINATDWTNLVS